MEPNPKRLLQKTDSILLPIRIPMPKVSRQQAVIWFLRHIKHTPCIHRMQGQRRKEPPNRQNTFL